MNFAEELFLVATKAARKDKERDTMTTDEREKCIERMLETARTEAEKGNFETPFDINAALLEISGKKGINAPDIKIMTAMRECGLSISYCPTTIGGIYKLDWSL